MHLVDPAVGAYVTPAEHEVHPWLASALYVPAGHVMQGGSAEEIEFRMLPAGHMVQTEEVLLAGYEPAAQLEHLLAPPTE